MKNKIYKYEIPVEDDFTLWLPQDAEILTVKTQRERPYFWAWVDLKAPTELRSFILRGTGHPFVKSAQIRYTYRGSFFLQEEIMIFHLFEINGPQP